MLLWLLLSSKGASISKGILTLVQGDCREETRCEPIKFLFLPKMGLLGSQVCTEKKLVLNSEQLFRAVFSCFHGQKLIYNFFYNVGSTLKSCLIQK